MPTPGQKSSRLVLDLTAPSSFDVVIQRINARINLAKTLRRWPAEIGREIERGPLPKLLRGLQQYPDRKRGMPIRWKSRKQRGYVLKLLSEIAKSEGHPDDISYRRTGRLAAGWKHRVIANDTGRDAGIRVIIWNDARGYKLARGGGLTLGEPYQKFVTGALGLGLSRRSIQRYKKPQQPFHVDRGWDLAYTKVQRGYREFEQLALNDWDARIEALRAQV